MSVVIKTIKDYFNNYVYPKTKTKAVYDDSNNRLDTTLSTVVHFDNDSASGTISDPVLKQSDIATTLGTSDTKTASQKLVNTVNTTLGSASSASAVSGADAFSKISTLNSHLTAETFNLAANTDNISLLSYKACKLNNLIIITGVWAGTDVTNTVNIATLPGGVRPSSAVEGSGMLRKASDSTLLIADYTINTSGVIKQGTTSKECDRGNFTFVYTI